MIERYKPLNFMKLSHNLAFSLISYGAKKQRTAQKMATTERLPRWNLHKSFGYASPNDPKIDRDLASYRRFCRGFADRYKGKVAGLSDEELARAVDRYHAGDDLYARLTTYVTMSHERKKDNLTTKAVYDKIFRKTSEASGLSVYFEEELTDLSKERLRAFKANPLIPRKYKTYVEGFVASKHSIVSTAQANAISLFEPLLEDIEGLYAQLFATQRFVLNGKSLDYTSMYEKMYRDPDPKVREAALDTFIRSIAPLRTTFEAVMNTGLKYRANHHELYNYTHPTEQWNVDNGIYDSRIPLRMLAAVNNANITQQFFALKAKLMGKAQLDPWDIKAAVPNLPDRHYSWKEAREIVVAAFTHFHPELGAVAKQAFDEGWIDAPPGNGKHTWLGITYDGSKQLTPHVMVNWLGNYSSLTVLAHEVGHAVAMHVQKQKLGNILSSHPRMISELCAFFAERMLSEELERRAQTPQEKCWAAYQSLASHQVANMVHALSYGSAVALQKQYLKTNRQQVTSAALDAWYLEGKQKLYGGAVRNLEKTAPMWVADEAQFSDPFYMGDYAMMCLVAQVLFDKRRSGEIPNLGDRIIKMLHKGNMYETIDLMKGLGADISQPGFWRKGVNGIQREMDELEQLVNEANLTPAPAKKFENYVQARRSNAAANSR